MPLPTHRPILRLFPLLAITSATLALARPAHADQWALLIGIDQYEDTNHITSLGGAAADARALAHTLESAAGFSEEHVKLLVSDGDVKPTRTNILNELARLTRNAQPGDTVFVLYSGHGIDVNGTPYLLPYDTSALDDDTITDTALETSKFRARLGQVKARALVLAFDMCRSDPRKTGKDVTAADNKLTHALARGLDFTQTSASKKPVADAATAASPIAVTLYSCAEGQRSYEWQDKGRGYFSYFLEAGLKGGAADAAGRITVGGLAKYVETQVQSRVETEEHHAQTPYPNLDGPGAADFVLATTTPASKTGGVVTIRPVETPDATTLDTNAYVTVTVNAANATVLIDGKPASSGKEASIDLGLDKSRVVEIGASAPGYKAVRKSVKLTAGVRFALPVALVAAPKPAVPPVSPAVVGGGGVAVAHAAVAPFHVRLATLTGHTVPVHAAAFSPDGHYIISGSTDGNAILWNAANAQEAHALHGGTFEVTTTAFSPDSKLALTASGDGTVRIWDVATGQVAQTTEGNAGSLNGAAFSPDGKHVVAGSDNGSVHTWNVETGAQELNFRAHGDSVFATAYSPDGHRLLTAGADNVAKLWDAATGHELRTLSGHTAFIYAANFSPEGRFVVTGSEDKTAKIWDTTTGSVVRTLAGHTAPVRAAAFSPDGKFVVTSSEDGTAKLWDAATGREIRTFRGHNSTVFAAGFSPDGRYIVTASGDETVRVWDVATGQTSVQ